MAIAFDAASDGGFASSTSLTWSHTCTGSDRFLVVNVLLGGSDDITSVTYNSVGMTHVDTEVVPTSGFHCKIYVLTAPATGANNVVVSRTSSAAIEAGGVSYTGVSQTGQPEASAKNTAAAALGITLTVTVATDQAWIVAGVQSNFTGVEFSAGSGTTMRQTNSAAAGQQGLFDSGGPLGTGSQSLRVDKVSNNFAGVIVSLAPVGGGGGTVIPVLMNQYRQRWS